MQLPSKIQDDPMPMMVNTNQMSSLEQKIRQKICRKPVGLFLLCPRDVSAPVRPFVTLYDIELV